MAHIHDENCNHDHEVKTESPSGIASSATPVIIVGTDADARVAADLATVQEIVVYGFMTTNAEDEGKELNDISILMRLDSSEGKKFLDKESVEVIVAARDIAERKDLAKKVEVRAAHVVNLIYPDIIISPYSRLGKGNIILSGLVVLANSQIGSYNSIQSQVFLDADVSVGNFCTLQAGVKIGRGVIIDDEAFIGMGAMIASGVKIGKGALVAPGAVVLQSVKDGEKVFGNPASKKG